MCKILFQYVINIFKVISEFYKEYIWQHACYNTNVLHDTTVKIKCSSARTTK
jgi:hypothetical protein